MCAGVRHAEIDGNDRCACVTLGTHFVVFPCCCQVSSRYNLHVLFAEGMLAHFGSGLAVLTFCVTLATFPMPSCNHDDWQNERMQWFAQGWRDPVDWWSEAAWWRGWENTRIDWWSEAEWREWETPRMMWTGDSELRSPPVSLTRATLQGHGAIGVTGRQRLSRLEQTFVVGRQQSSSESWPWHHPLIRFDRNEHIQMERDQRETVGRTIEAEPQAHEKQAPSSRDCSQGERGGGALEEEVQVRNTPSSSVECPQEPSDGVADESLARVAE